MPDLPASDPTRRTRGRPKSSKPRGVQSAASSLDVLKVLQTTDRPMQLREIAAALQRDASTVYRYLVTFIDAELVKQDEQGRYDLGPMAIQMGLAALRRLDGLAIATEQLAKLVDRAGADGHVSVWGTYGPTIVRAIARPLDVVVRVQEGWVVPLMSSATGRTWAAHMPAETLKPVIKRELAINDPAMVRGTRSERVKAFNDAAEAVRRVGHSFASGERRVGVDALCAPAFNRHGSIAYAITLVAEHPRLSPGDNPAMLAALLDATGAISRSLGFAAATSVP